MKYLGVTVMLWVCAALACETGDVAAFEGSPATSIDQSGDPVEPEKKKEASGDEVCERPNRLFSLMVQERDKAALNVTQLEQKCNLPANPDQTRECEKQLGVARADLKALVEALPLVPKTLPVTTAEKGKCGS